MSQTPGWTTPGEPSQEPQHGQEPPYGQPPEYGQPEYGAQQYGAQQYGQPQYGQFAPRPPAAVKPGIVPLRPLGLGELYDGAFQAIRRNPRTMLGVAAVVVTILTVVDIGFQLALAGSLSVLLDPAATTAPDVDELLGALGGFGVYALASLVLDLLGISLITGMLILSVSRAVLGQQMSLGELWTAIRGRLPALVGINIVVALLVGAVFVVPIALGFAGLLVADWVGALLIIGGFLLGTCLAFYFGVRTSMGVPALILEEAGVGTALRRTWELVRGSYFRVLGILLLTVVISFVTTLIISAPFGLVGGGLAVVNPDDPLTAAGLAPVQLVLSGIGGIIASTIVYPFTAAVTALLYIDLRMRREGLDVELARAAGSPGA